MSASKSFLDQHGKCVFCDIIEKESRSPRLIYDNSDFVVLAPYASVHPMEFWILPKKHDANILNLTSAEIAAFAETLKTSLKGTERLGE